MKIGDSGKSKSVKGTKRKKSVSGTSSGAVAFADELRNASPTERAHAPAYVDGPNAIDGVDALLAMQEVGEVDDERTRRKAAAYGRDLLDKLQDLQGALLAGAIEKEKLMALAHKIRTARVRVQDERLSTILDEIELRVEVEIAKHALGR